jgi:hypothetical protein
MSHHESRYRRHRAERGAGAKPPYRGLGCPQILLFPARRRRRQKVAHGITLPEMRRGKIGNRHRARS